MTDAPKANYSAFSEFLSNYPNELSLARFRDLNIRNLLFYQAELVHLETQLRGIEVLDARKYHPDPDTRTNRRWNRASKQQAPTESNTSRTRTDGDMDPSGSISIQNLCIDKILEIRQVLAEYNKALKRYAYLETLPNPSNHSMKAIRTWLNRSEYGRSFIKGTVEDVWGSDRDRVDFLTFTSQKGVALHLASLSAKVKQIFTKAGRQGLYSIGGAEDGGVAQGISVVISSTFPVLPIIILFFVRSLLVRIVLILVFTAVFATVLVFGLDIRPEKTLAITSAIAAVQVVFVGSTSNGGSA